jgi:CBS domain-containing protein
MREANIGIMPVCERNGRVIGVVTDRDLALRICAEDVRPSTTEIAEVMTRGAIACGPDDSVQRAEALMRKHRITRILVIDGSACLLGVISLSDLVFYEPTSRMGRTLRAIAERKYEPERGP